MAIQIHQLNEISTPAMTDYLADDNGTDTGKLSIETLAGAILADYQATFDDDTTDVVSKVTAIATAQTTDEANIATLQTDVSGKVDKAGDTMTGSLTITGDSVNRYLRFNNGVRNVRLTANSDGNFGLYDDTADQSGWILRSTAGNGSLITPASFSASGSLTAGGSLTLGGHSSAVGSILSATISTATAFTSGSWQEMLTLSLPAGTWLLLGVATCSTTTSSADASKFFTLQLTHGDGYSRQTVSLVSSVYSSGSLSDVYSVSSTANVALRIYAGTNISIYRAHFRAVRIV